jgi:NlpC/P60 family
MPKVLRRAAAAVAVPALVLLCCLACAVGVLALSSGTAEAKPKRAAKSGHHVVRRHPLRLRHARRRKHHTRRARLLRAERRARNRVVQLAWRAVGVRYRWGGGSPRAGFDCSGLTQRVYRQVGVSLPHYTFAQWRYGRRVARRALAPGDLLFFSGFRHVGIYLGHGALIDAPHSGARVRFERFSGWFASSFVGGRLRLVG